MRRRAHFAFDMTSRGLILWLSHVTQLAHIRKILEHAQRPSAFFDLLIDIISPMERVPQMTDVHVIPTYFAPLLLDFRLPYLKPF